MRKKYIFLGIGILLILVAVYLRNIIFAIALRSENIDRHTFEVMFQGRGTPQKKISLIINDSSYDIPLPYGSGKLNENEYLVPTSSWKAYSDNLKAAEWESFDQTGTLVRVKNKIGDEFNISVRPFTGAYLILRYSSVTK